MSAGFTPGPWAVGKEIGYGQLNGIQIRDSKGYVVAVVVADTPELYESRKANARLIAAAPELYEAAAAIEYRANQCGGSFDDIPRDELNALLSGALSDALAKARGEQ